MMRWIAIKLALALLSLVAWGSASLVSAAPSSTSPVFTFSGGSNKFPGARSPILEGDLVGTYSSATSGTLTGFVGSATYNDPSGDGDPGTGAFGFTDYQNAGTGAFAGSSGQWSVSGFNFSLSDGTTTWLYSSGPFAGGAGSVQFTVTKVGDATFQPTIHTYNVVSAPEIDGAVLPRAAAIIGGFAILILFGARRRSDLISSDA